LTVGFWVNYTKKPDIIEFLTNPNSSSWRMVDPTTFTEELDFSATLDINNAAPLEKQEVKNATLEFLAIINNYPQIAASPNAIRMIADLLNLKNESFVSEMQRVAMVAMVGQAQTGQENALAQRSVAKVTPTENEQITNQLQNQVGIPNA
jgi:hypothetical protein